MIVVPGMWGAWSSLMLKRKAVRLRGLVKSPGPIHYGITSESSFANLQFVHWQ